MQKQQETRYYKNEIYGEQKINDGQGFQKNSYQPKTKFAALGAHSRINSQFIREITAIKTMKKEKPMMADIVKRMSKKTNPFEEIAKDSQE